jgi:hypothetical protein
MCLPFSLELFHRVNRILSNSYITWKHNWQESLITCLTLSLYLPILRIMSQFPSNSQKWPKMTFKTYLINTVSSWTLPDLMCSPHDNFLVVARPAPSWLVEAFLGSFPWDTIQKALIASFPSRIRRSLGLVLFRSSPRPWSSRQHHPTLPGLIATGRVGHHQAIHCWRKIIMSPYW